MKLKPEDIIPGLRISCGDGSVLRVIAEVDGEGFTFLDEETWNFANRLERSSEVADFINSMGWEIYVS